MVYGFCSLFKPLSLLETPFEIVSVAWQCFLAVAAKTNRRCCSFCHRRSVYRSAFFTYFIILHFQADVLAFAFTIYTVHSHKARVLSGNFNFAVCQRLWVYFSITVYNHIAVDREIIFFPLSLFHFSQQFTLFAFPDDVRCRQWHEILKGARQRLRCFVLFFKLLPAMLNMASCCPFLARILSESCRFMRSGCDVDSFYPTKNHSHRVASRHTTRKQYKMK